MKPRVAIIAALPREIGGLARSLQQDRSWLATGVHLYRTGDVVLVAAGMGAERAAIAVQAACSAFTPELLVSTGLAGACDVRVAPGCLLEAEFVVDARTGERFRAVAPQSAILLASSHAIASVAEKARLAATYGASLVDMEASTVARLATSRGIAFRAIKGVSDAHDFELSGLEQFSDSRGQFRTAAFALHTAWRPAQWGRAMDLGRNSARALTLLQTRLQELFL